MKLTDLLSCTTCTISPDSSAPLPPAPCAQCSVAPPDDRFDVKTQNMPVLRVGSLFRVNGLDMTTVEEIVGGVSFAELGILHGETLDRACLAIRNATVDAINRLTPLLG